MTDRKMDDNFKRLLTETVRLLRKDLSWLTSLSAKQRFCWGILSTCCAKITLSQDNFEWVHHYSGIIVDLQLGLVFSTYCTGKKLPSEQCIIVSQLPPEIQAHPSEDMRRYRLTPLRCGRACRKAFLCINMPGLLESQDSYMMYISCDGHMVITCCLQVL